MWIRLDRNRYRLWQQNELVCHRADAQVDQREQLGERLLVVGNVVAGKLQLPSKAS